jgi:hypothetical protein
MEDIIDIIVTETTNTIEITSQASDELIDVNIIDNREDITLNVTPTLVEININSLTGNFGVEWGDITGTLSDQTDLNTALGLKADLVDGKVPSSQLPSYVDDIIEVATYSALPATGETGKIYVVLDTNLIYRWSGSAYIEIKDSSAVWGAITGTLSSQTDLQNALNAKFDDPTGDTTQYIAGDGSLITFPVAGQAGTLVREVRNTTGSTITKGTVVYISGATGNKPTISKALATSDSTSAQTFGLAQADISNNSNGYVVCVGDLTGIDTSALTEGQQLYLSSTTAGTYTTTKQLAPAHLVYIGVVTRSHPTLGQIEVKIQNGYELDEIHDVAISSVANNDGLFYESSTSLWKNKSIATVLGYTPVQGTGDTGYYARWTSAGVLSDGFIQTTSNITYVEGMGLSTLNGLDITGNYGAGGGGLKIRSYDETTGNAYIDFANTGGRFYLGVNRSTASGLMTNATAYATVLTTGLGTTNLEFGTNATKRLTLDGTTGAATFTSSVTASAIYLTNMTAGSGALYYSTGANRLTLANYNANGIVLFEVNGGATALTLNSNLSATFASTISATGATLTGALSGTSATFTTDLISQYHTVQDLGNTGDYVLRFKNNSGTQIAYIGRIASDNKTYYSNSNGHSFTGGAATFSSSVAINGETLTIGGTTNNAVINNIASVRINIDSDNSGTGESFIIGHNQTAIDNNNVLFKVQDNGNVGIGTTSPGAKLEIASASFQDHLILNRTGVGLMHITATNPRGLAITDGTTQFMTIVQSSGNVGIGTTAPGAKLEVVNSAGSQLLIGYGGNADNYYDATNHFFRSASGANNRMFINGSTGNVGIGTTSPDVKLQVRNDVNGNSLVAKFSNLDTNAGTGAYIGFNTGYDATARIGALREGAGNSSSLIFLPMVNETPTERMRITSGGLLYINTSSGDGQISVDFNANNTSGIAYKETATVSNAAFCVFKNSGGTEIGSIRRITTTNAVNFNTTSDYRLKEDLKPINGLEIVNKINVYDYKWKSHTSRMDGVLAHELAEVLPYAVTGVKDGEQMQSVDYSKIVPVMVQAIKELKAELDTLKNK